MRKPLFLVGLLSAVAIVHADDAAQPSSQDKQFVAETASGGMLEWRLGQFASANTANADVRRFAESLVGDHDKANQELKEIASEKGIEIPHALGSDDQKTLDRLEQITSDNFDPAYVAQMIDDHQKTIAAFEKEIQNGTDIRVKGFAERILPTLKHHLEMSKALQGHVQPGAGK